MPTLPPNSVYPINYDTDHTLFKVYNTTESIITANLEAWATTIYIVPVESDQNEIWPTNGFATINGELLYYDTVGTDLNDKINSLLNCTRSLGGKPAKYNKTGTGIRSFVMAEHHNQLATSIVSLENFIGVNLSSDKETLDWRIRNLASQLEISDDYGCPQIEFVYYITNVDPLLGTTIQYTLEIVGTYISFILDFGDNTITTTDLIDTHVYPPNSKIDPTVTVTSSVCQSVNSGIVRNQPSEPLINIIPQDLNITLSPLPSLPDLIIQYASDVSADVNLPPIVFPCLDIGPFGPISIPSTIVIDPPFVIPSQIVFNNIPIIPTTINVSPINVVVSGDQYIDLVCIPVGGDGLGYYGYAVGGRTGVGNSATGTSDKVSYKTDIASSSSAVIPLSTRYGASGFSNATHGYIAGGQGPTSAYTSTFYRFEFEKETISLYGTAILSQEKNYSVGLSNENVKGYTAGGLVNGSSVNVIDVLSYATESMKTTATFSLSASKYWHAGVSQQTDKGYISGGLLGSSFSAAVKTTDLIFYATDTFGAKTTCELKYPRAIFTAIDGNNYQGYYGGGSSNTAGPALFSSIEKMHYPSDSTVALYIVLDNGRSGAGGISEGSAKGYFVGGYNPSILSSLQIIHYLNDVISAVSTTLSQPRAVMTCLSHISTGAVTLTPASTPASTPTVTPAGTPADTPTGTGCGTCTWAARAIAVSGNNTLYEWVKSGNSCTGNCGCADADKPANVSAPTASIPPADIIVDCKVVFGFSSNGYLPPEEAFLSFTPTTQGYDNGETQLLQSNITASSIRFIEPTPDEKLVNAYNNDFENNIQQAFKTVKVRLKEEEILPNIKDLLGD